MCGIVTCKDQMYCIADGISDHISLTTGVSGSRLSSETGRGRRLRRDPTGTLQSHPLPTFSE